MKLVVVGVVFVGIVVVGVPDVRVVLVLVGELVLVLGKEEGIVGVMVDMVVFDPLPVEDVEVGVVVEDDGSPSSPFPRPVPWPSGPPWLVPWP